MVAEGVKISSDVTYVFTNGVKKEEKDKTITKPTMGGFSNEEHYQKSVPILIFLIQNS